MKCERKSRGQRVPTRCDLRRKPISLQQNLVSVLNISLPYFMKQFYRWDVRPLFTTIFCILGHISLLIKDSETIDGLRLARTNCGPTTLPRHPSQSRQALTPYPTLSATTGTASRPRTFRSRRRFPTVLPIEI